MQEDLFAIVSCPHVGLDDVAELLVELLHVPRIGVTGIVVGHIVVNAIGPVPGIIEHLDCVGACE